jgi:alkylhydroperoxidase family enzyme
MVDFDYSAAGVPIRDDLRNAHRFIWAHLRSPGTWWTGRQRVAIAVESRNATSCTLCRDRKAALSPNAVQGHHDSLGQLPDNVVEAIHRIRTDPARLSKAWFDRLIASGLEETQYVELVGVITLLAGVDYFARALGIAPFPLPEPLAGEPSRHRPASAKLGTGWVPMIAPEDGDGPEADLYGNTPFVPNIMRALSLVPDEARALQRSSNAHYVPVAQIGDPTARKSLDRMQIELLAARVSALNECFY